MFAPLSLCAFESTPVRLKNIIIFGSTGSIGLNCLEIVQRHPERFKITGLAAKDNYELLARQTQEFGVKTVCIGNPAHYDSLKKLLPADTKVFSGNDEILDLLDTGDKVDLAVNAMVGAAGLLPTLKVLDKGITLALANKESLVAGGALALQTAEKSGAQLLPIDSEHSAIFQCLLGEDRKTISSLILTASGGPFVDTPAEQFPFIKPEQALKHPNWSMGARITIDSATMVNKGLEVIEARWLFNIPADKIQVAVHRQSIVHSLVRFEDGSYLAQMGAPDMRLPIQFALTYPERLPSPYCKLDFSTAINLSFEPVQADKFPGLGLAYEALRRNGVFPAVLNAADETAVEAFLKGKISFDKIPQLIEQALNYAEKDSGFSGASEFSLEDILSADREARKYVGKALL